MERVTEPAIGTSVHSSSEELVQVEIPESKLYLLRPVPIVVGPILVLWASWALWPVGNPLLVGSIALFIYGLVALGLFRAAQLRIRENVTRLIARHEGAPVAQLVAKLFGPRGRAMPLTHWEATVLALAAHGRAGVTIRSSPPKFATAAIDPITVRFEPRLLDEADESLVTLGEALDAPADDAVSDVRTSLMSWPPLPLSRRMKRNVALGGGWLVVGIFAFMAASNGWRSLKSGRVTAEFAMFTLFLVIVLLGVMQTWSTRGRRQWLVVPGGVLTREGRWLGRRCRLHLFDRRKSVLLIHRLSKHGWVAYVADGEAHHRATMTPHETTFLLRAWLSPLSPPPVERLSDLA